jgi:hypothetical protein
MRYIDHHAHMVSRDDGRLRADGADRLRRVDRARVLGGWDRSTVEGFEDYFRN